MSPTLNHLRKDFIRQCDSAIGTLTKEFQFILDIENSPVWSSYLAQRKLLSRHREDTHTLFEMEKTMIDRLKTFADCFDSDTLSWCTKLVREGERNAREAMRSIVAHIHATLHPKPKQEYLVQDKALLRALVRTHWKMVDCFSSPSTPPDIAKQLSLIITHMREALRKLEWLCVVFISYAHKDNKAPKKHLDKFVTICQPRLREEHIELWWDRKQPAPYQQGEWWDRGIPEATRWRKELKSNLRLIDIAIPLVSENFFKSDFSIKHELLPLKGRHEREGVRIFPLILKHAKRTRKTKGVKQNVQEWLSELQYLPTDGEVITKHYQNDQDLENLYTGQVVPRVIQLVEELSDKERVLGKRKG